MQDLLTNTKQGVVATRSGLADPHHNKVLRQTVQERSKNSNFETSRIADALVQKLGVQVFIHSINKYDNDESIYDGAESVKHLKTDEACACGGAREGALRDCGRRIE